MKIYIVSDLEYSTLITKKGCSRFPITDDLTNACEEILKRTTPRDKIILCELLSDRGRCHYMCEFLKLKGMDVVIYHNGALSDFLPNKLEEE